jgi:hypothetical protein
MEIKTKQKLLKIRFLFLIIGSTVVLNLNPQTTEEKVALLTGVACCLIYFLLEIILRQRN